MMLTNPRYKLGLIGSIAIFLLLCLLLVDIIGEFRILSLFNYPANPDPMSQRAVGVQRVKAAFVILARNGDIEELRRSIRQLEKSFNKKFNYPYVFLNDKEFTDEFKTAMRMLSSSYMSFGLIPKNHWSYPSWIDQNKSSQAINEMGQTNLLYGGSLSYRHMCRFNSGFFFRHPLLDGLEYYWRVEPGVDFLCQIDYDPFLFMKLNNKKYGFVIAMWDSYESLPTLWNTTKEFLIKNSNLLSSRNSFDVVQHAEHGGYNLCHYWSNFEIASLDFFRSEKYLKYFDYLDHAGGFFYERWGDAPVHSIAASIFLPKDQIHYFEDIGYDHNSIQNCPRNPEMLKKGRCTCDLKKSFTHSGCHYNYERSKGVSFANISMDRIVS